MVQVFSRYGVLHNISLFMLPVYATIRVSVMIQLLLRYGVLHNISLFMLPVFSCYRFLQRYRISSWYRSFHDTGFCHGTGFRRVNLQVSCIPPGAFFIRHTRKREFFRNFSPSAFGSFYFKKVIRQHAGIDRHDKLKLYPHSVFKKFLNDCHVLLS